LPQCFDLFLITENKVTGDTVTVMGDMEEVTVDMDMGVDMAVVVSYMGVLIVLNANLIGARNDCMSDLKSGHGGYGHSHGHGHGGHGGHGGYGHSHGHGHGGHGGGHGGYGHGGGGHGGGHGGYGHGGGHGGGGYGHGHGGHGHGHGGYGHGK